MNFGTFAVGDVTVLLSNGDSVVLASAGAGDYSTTEFVGLTDSRAFTTVLVRVKGKRPGTLRSRAAQ
jgi:hypothetical protein